jgi:hypothetical protein
LLYLRWHWHRMKKVALEDDAHLAREIQQAIDDGVDLPDTVFKQAGMDKEKNNKKKKNAEEIKEDVH